MGTHGLSPWASSSLVSGLYGMSSHCMYAQDLEIKTWIYLMICMYVCMYVMYVCNVSFNINCLLLFGKWLFNVSK